MGAAFRTRSLPRSRTRSSVKLLQASCPDKQDTMLAGEPPKIPLRRLAASASHSPASTSSSPHRLREFSSEDEQRKMAARRRKSVVDDRLRRQSAMFSPARRPAAGAPSAAPLTPSRPKLSDAELRSSFEEWMKIAADNKINANNSWNLALIDYFADMTLLRDGDSINFQKASCTLDGCVKIYTSRVDSVDSETKKLLSGLVETSTRVESDGDGEGDDNDNAEGGKRPRRKAHRSGNTLEKDINNLNVKTLDLEFMVDPLFKKTSADFDEGGAHGLLLNHLSISSEGKMIFDASDVGVPADEADNAGTQTAQEEPPRERIDMTKLHARFADTFSSLWDQEVCPSLNHFEFSDSTAAMPFPQMSSFDDLSERLANDMSDDDDDDFGGHANYDDNPFYDSGNADASISFREDRDIVSTIGPGNPLPDSAVVVMGKGEDSIFSYFDSALMRSWAGPEHWRPRPLAKEKKAPGTVRKKRKVEDTIDFLAEEQVNLEALFAPATASIVLPKQQDKTRSNHLLPDDMHFSSKDLLKLFLKPQYKIKFYRKDRAGSAPVNHEADGPVEESFWAEHQAAPEDGLPPVDASQDRTEFDDDDDEFEDAEEGFSQTDLGGASAFGAGIDFGDSLVDEPRRVKAVPLSYARVAKKVDVKKLKDNIWRGLTADSREAQADIEGEENSSENDTRVVDGVKTLKGVVATLDAYYPEKKRKDISVAFCFICVLHLANEKNLRVVGGAGAGSGGEASLADLTIVQG
ncbi:hypothetical protein HDU89_003325 [Geranomyces variabilis]|nr:hypothetical protein HDU89_003325 [Geranomyces variabilis]